MIPGGGTQRKGRLAVCSTRVHPLEIGIASGKREQASPQEEKDELGQRYMHCRQGPDMQHTGREGFKFYESEDVVVLCDSIFRECMVQIILAKPEVISFDGNSL